jgi:choice-of-anchor B domain-containing protein
LHAQDAKGKTGAGSLLAAKSAQGSVMCLDGSAADYPCLNVDLVSFLPLAEMGAGPGGRLNDAWGWVDPETGQRWALMGRQDGVSFVDITNPASPRYAGELPMPATAQSNVWRDIKVDGWYAFVVADGSASRQGMHGMQVFDLRRLRDANATPITFTADANYTEFFVVHNVVVNEDSDRAYGVGGRRDKQSCNGGLHMIDISDPLNPTFLGCFADRGTGRAGGGYIHDAQCVVYDGPDRAYAGREICVGSNETAISIADVTDPTAPVGISRGTYPNASYVHQGWFSEDQRYFIQNDELDERVFDARTHTYIWDLADLDDPVLLTDFAANVVSTDHNLYVRGDFVYQANYSSGLRIMDISNPEDPFVAGYFDTRPEDSAVNFNGAWTAWPFPDSDLVIISSRGEGLFVVRPSSFMGTRFTAFDAVAESNGVRLTWSLNQVSEVDRFEIIQFDATGPQVTDVVAVTPGQTTSSAFLETGEGAFRLRISAVSKCGGRIESTEYVITVLSGTHLIEAPWPNPATVTAQSKVIVSSSQMVSASVHDALGRERIRLFDDRLAPEEALPIRIDTSSLEPGTYFLHVVGETFSETISFVVAR